MEPVDRSRWPLLELDLTRTPQADAPRAVTAALRAAIERGEAFAAVLHMPDAPRERRVAGAVDRIRMLKSVRPGLARHCRGLAFVMSERARRDNAKAVASGAKLWGCPTTAAADAAEARAWAAARLGAADQGGG